MSNLDLYNKVRAVPAEAQKPISGGRLNGKTDINPMWRIKALTEQFGMCGIGWYPEVLRQWTETGANGEVAAFCNINLYVKVGDEWSKPIFGTGGSALIAKESKGLNTSDECYKMALTDAISVACKHLGFGADIYWEKDRSKYDKPAEPPKSAAAPPKEPPRITAAQVAEIAIELTRVGWDIGSMLEYLGKQFKCKIPVVESITPVQFKFIMGKMKEKPDKGDANG